MTSICLKVHVYKKKISPRFLIGAINGCDRYGSWIDNYLCNQCLSPMKLWVQIPLRRGVLDTTLCDKVC
jgi:hypothetical protein